MFITIKEAEEESLAAAISALQLVILNILTVNLENYDL